jgi:hypothetical protein
MNVIWEASEFIRRVRVRMRFGDLSRAPIELLRLQVNKSEAECDWLIRPMDPWDLVLPERIRETNHSLQALRDALTMREILFAAFRDLRTAEFRVFRPSGQREPELIMTGTIDRKDEVPLRIPSVAMRAKLCGFRFSLSDGVLTAMVR